MNNASKQIVNKVWKFPHVLRDDGLSYMVHGQRQNVKLVKLSVVFHLGIVGDRCWLHGELAAFGTAPWIGLAAHVSLVG